MSVILSTRGIPLALVSPPSFPCLAVESYCKWYGLYLVFGPESAATVMQWQPTIKQEQESGSWIMGDHIFNPQTLRKCSLPAPIDPISWEIIVGRYITVFREWDFPEMQADLYSGEVGL